MKKIMSDTMNATDTKTLMREHFNFATPGTPLWHQIHGGLLAMHAETNPPLQKAADPKPADEQTA